MSGVHSLLSVEAAGPLLEFLAEIGDVFAVFNRQDSGCLSAGVAIGDERWFVKAATGPVSAESVYSARLLHAAVQHPAIVPLRHTLTCAGLPANVFPWQEGEVLYHPTVAHRPDRSAVHSPMARFRRLPVPDVLAAAERILSAHEAVEQAGFVAVDLYDGCFLYDFTTRRMNLCDLDEYRPGPFTLEADRLPGSSRFMAAEEFQRGSVIDTRTTVFNLGRALRLLLDAGDTETHWRGSPDQLAVTARATRTAPGDRYANVYELAAGWRAATPHDHA